MLNLFKQGIALRLRWEWLKRTDDLRPWQGLNLMADKQVTMVFNNLVKWEVGNGRRVLFWKDRWINGSSIAEVAPMIRAMIKTQIANRRTVKDALHLHTWTTDIVGDMSTDALVQFIRLWDLVIGMNLDPDSEDKPLWQWSSNGIYSARTAYKMLCEGGI